jgi:hypothetical protein
MDQIEIIENIQLSYLVQKINGNKGGTDTTIFLWKNGSIHSTIPATPNNLRGSELFRMLRHLPPKAKFNGEMRINRQGGEVKNWTFEEKI